jgi:hypothetical protein
VRSAFGPKPAVDEAPDTVVLPRLVLPAIQLPIAPQLDVAALQAGLQAAARAVEEMMYAAAVAGLARAIGEAAAMARLEAPACAAGRGEPPDVTSNQT